MKINSYLNRLKLRRFYGSITKQELKKVIEKAALNTNVLGRSFIYLLESRLDVILYRANFFSSIMAARQYINHKKVFVNGILANKPSQRLFLNDIINISDPLLVYNQLQQRLINKKLLINYPVYLEVNYRLGSIILTKMPLNDEVPYPFFFFFYSIAHNF